MSRDVTTCDDLKTAGLLAAAFGMLAAITVPFLLNALPPEAQKLPLPVPVFSILLALQSLVVYGLLSWGGLRLARKHGLEPAPLLTSLWTGKRPPRLLRPLGFAFGAGIFCGILLLATVAAIRHLAPETLPRLLHPPSLSVALLASATASIGEELLFRLFLLSVLLRLLPPSRGGVFLAIVFSAILFGAAHAPGLVWLFGGLQSVPPVAWVWLISLNGLVGVACGVFFIKAGIDGAILAHFGADLVWHVMSQLGGA